MDSIYWNNHRDWLRATPERLVIKYLIERDLNRIIKQARIRTVLDLGCGFGVWFPLYNDHKLTVTGADYSNERLQAARQVIEEFSLKNITLLECDIFNPEIYELENEPYDLVMLSYVLQHLYPNQACELIKKARDVAKNIVILGYYNEPADTFIKQYETMCRNVRVKPYNFEKNFNSIAYDYPKMFNLPYERLQYPMDNALLHFKRAII